MPRDIIRSENIYGGGGRGVTLSLLSLLSLSDLRFLNKDMFLGQHGHIFGTTATRTKSKPRQQGCNKDKSWDKENTNKNCNVGYIENKD